MIDQKQIEEWKALLVGGGTIPWETVYDVAYRTALPALLAEFERAQALRRGIAWLAQQHRKHPALDPVESLQRLLDGDAKEPGEHARVMEYRDLLAEREEIREQTIREVIAYVLTWTGPTGTGTSNIRDAVADRLSALLKQDARTVPK